MTATYMFQNVVGCNDIGAPTKEFPKGIPENCIEGDDGTLFYVAMYVTKGLTLVITLGCGKLGLMFADFFLMLSAAMVGAGMTINALTDLISTIVTLAGSPELVATLIGPIDGAKVITTYALAGTGFLCMAGMKPYTACFRKNVQARREYLDTYAKNKAEGTEQESLITKWEKMPGYAPLPKPMGIARVVMGSKACCCFSFCLRRLQKVELMIDDKLNGKAMPAGGFGQKLTN